MVSRVAFGAMSLAKINDEEKAVSLVQSAYEKGINFFDTTRDNSDCERLLGDSIDEIRANIIVATKTRAQSGNELLADFETSLNAMHIDRIDLYQYETENFLPQKNAPDRIYDTLNNLKARGKVRAIGITAVDLNVARLAITSGLYDTIQFPFSMVTSERAIELVWLCEENDVGFIAMQPLCGGLVENIPLAFGFLHQFENVIPLWGVQTEEELTQILYFNEHPPIVDDKFKRKWSKSASFLIRLFWGGGERRSPNQTGIQQSMENDFMHSPCQTKSLKSTELNCSFFCCFCATGFCSVGSCVFEAARASRSA